MKLREWWEIRKISVSQEHDLTCCNNSRGEHKRVLRAIEWRTFIFTAYLPSSEVHQFQQLVSKLSRLKTWANGSMEKSQNYIIK